MKAFDDRATWLRFLDGGILEQMQQMIAEFGKMGVVTRKTVEPPQPGFPKVVYVEEGVAFKSNPPHHNNRTASPAGRTSRRKQARRAAASSS